MKKHLVLLGMLFLTSVAVFGDGLTAVVSDSQKIIQDPKTKVIYYLESDLRHIAALSPNGKLLWFCEVVPASAPRRIHVVYFELPADDDVVIRVQSLGNPAGIASGIINKKFGFYTLQMQE